MSRAEFRGWVALGAGSGLFTAAVAAGYALAKWWS